MIACLRTVTVPAGMRERYLAGIGEGRAVRQAHGTLAELALEPSGADGETAVATIRPSHEVSGAWNATPERDRLTAREVHQAVSYQPITRYGIAGGYLNHLGLAAARPGPQAQEETP